MARHVRIEGMHSAITFDKDLELFRGEFVGLTGGADFYAKDEKTLRDEGRKSLRTYLDLCVENNLDPVHNPDGC